MNWLTKILKKEKAVEKKDGVEKKTVLVGEGGGVKTKAESLRVRKKFDPGVILAYHLTEKTSAGGEDNKYTFKVSSGAGKTAVKNAVEGRFNVQVESINMVNTPGKERKKGGQIGFKPGFKKAIITLEEGESIEIT